MKFSLCTANHPYKAGIQDHLGLLRMLVEIAGHSVSDGAGGTEVWIENSGVELADHFLAMRDRGRDCIIVASEFVTGETFNDFGEAISGHYGNQGYWRKRYLKFRACVRFAKALWLSSSDPGQYALYRDLAGEVPVITIPFPCFPELKGSRKEKKSDLCFWGAATSYRDLVLDRLKRRFNLSRPRYLPDELRRDVIARTRVGLAIPQGENWPYPSQMRYWKHLTQGGCILGVQCQGTCALDPYVLTAPAASLAESCGELLASDRWEKVAADAYGRFSTERPAKDAAIQLIDLTFSSAEAPCTSA